MRRTAARSARRAVAAALLAVLLGGGPAPAPASGAAIPAPAGPAARSVRTAAPVEPAEPPQAPLAQLVAPAGTTTLVSVGDTGGFPHNRSTTPSISSSGRYVAFASTATDILPGGTGGAVSVVYLRDRTAGTTIALPGPDGGPIPEGASATDPSISAGGTVVAFTYASARQVDAGYSSVVVWDRSTGSTTYVVTKGAGSVDRSREPALSANGQFVAFTSDDSWLVNNDSNESSDVFRYSRQTGAIDLVSVGLDNTSGNGDSSQPSISGDGSVVAFTSVAGSSLVSTAVGDGQQVYTRDMGSGTTTLESVGLGGAAASGESSAPAISDGGTVLAFSSAAVNLVAGTTSTPIEVYRRDRQAGVTTLVSAIDGTPNPYPSRQPGISRDGRMVAYVEVVPAAALALDVRQVAEVYICDTVAGKTALVSVNLSGQPSLSVSGQPQVAAAGRFVAFASSGTDLVPGAAGAPVSVYLRDLPPVPQLKPPKLDFGTRAVGITPASAAGILVNAGWGPLSVTGSSVAGTNAPDFTVLADGCAGKVLYNGDACTVTLGFAPSKDGPRTANLLVAYAFTGSPGTTVLTGNGSRAKIVLSPPIGPPGIVVQATGSGFPAGAKIALAWNIGITAVMPPVTADAAGGFSVPMLVMPNDRIGLRQLLATWVGGPQFPALQTPMLVTTAPAIPPRFLAGGAMPRSLVFRG